MKKMTLPLIVAIIIHFIFLALSGFLIGKTKTTFFEFQNVIPIQFGSEVGNRVGQSKDQSTLLNLKVKNAIAPRVRNKIEVGSSYSPAPNSNTNSGNNSRSSLGTGVSFESSIVNYQSPIYPRLAQIRGLQGNVRIKIMLSADGEVIEAKILSSSGHDILDKAAMEVVPQWSFQKQLRAYSVEKNIVFELKN